LFSIVKDCVGITELDLINEVETMMQ
jgi:hypothetical protein